MENISIKDLIPQKEPFVMVEKLLFCDTKKTRTLLSIKNDNIFMTPYHCGNVTPQSSEKNDDTLVFSQSGIIENVAQTCAACLGYLNRNQPVKIGMIGSINDFEFSENFAKVGDTIFTEITVETEIGNIILLNATVLCKNKNLATGKMKVVLTEIEIGK
jgi:3-hydroxymyristoyl/3-hydroxydecanoyl-(acyl carrier protein) dehydratase